MTQNPIKDRLEQKSAKREKKISIWRLIPNSLTILALCIGLTAIRLGLDGRFSMAVAALVFAALLDGLDGRVARLLKAESRIGAHLDSLVDFLNFGIAPILLVYMWGMEDMGRLGWLAMLLFTVCAALRLARFNTQTSNPDRPIWMDNFFVGMPTPAAGLLALMPLMLNFAGMASVQNYSIAICFYTIALAAMMISQLPTFSGKKLSLHFTRQQARPFMLAVALIAGILLTFPWIGLLLIGVAYLMAMPFVIWWHHRLKHTSSPPSSQDT